MPKNRKKNGHGGIVGGLFLVLLSLTLLIATLLHGNNIALFNPKGMIAHEQLRLMILVVSILLIIAIPTLTLLFFTAWRYRESNTKSTHDPNVRHNKLIDVGMWLIPSSFMAVLALIMWPATHRLEPQKAIHPDAKPLTVQVVSMRWKWLFIYPEQRIATVNYLQIPAHTPIRFDLTADNAPMSSFWIPNLAGMLYTMTGHTNRLNLVADTPGDYPGSSAEINGAGFAGMKFTTKVSSHADFDRWVGGVQASGKTLDTTEYERLLEPSENNPAALYVTPNPDIYDKVLMKYTGPGGHMHHGMHY
ncbi:MAG TPA: COX aromatic rich motif-containing protein [Candidatus Saccharimonadales bacterium]